MSDLGVSRAMAAGPGPYTAEEYLMIPGPTFSDPLWVHQVKKSSKQVGSGLFFRGPGITSCLQPRKTLEASRRAEVAVDKGESHICGVGVAWVYRWRVPISLLEIYKLRGLASHLEVASRLHSRVSFQF